MPDNLIEQAITLAHQQKVRYLELRTGVNHTLAGRSDMVQGDLYVRWVMPLTGDPNTLWSQLRKPVQHQIKKSRKLGVEIRMAESHEDVLRYYRLHLQTRSKKHGMPTQPQRYFLDAWDAFASHNMMQVLLAEHEGHTIAGMVLFAAGTTVRYAYGASDEQYLHLAPNNLLMWTAMTWGCTHGYQELDMGRTARDNEGLMEFKRRWGANTGTIALLPLSSRGWSGSNIRAEPEISSPHYLLAKIAITGRRSFRRSSVQAFRLSRHIHLSHYYSPLFPHYVNQLYTLVSYAFYKSNQVAHHISLTYRESANGGDSWQSKQRLFKPSVYTLAIREQSVYSTSSSRFC